MIIKILGSGCKKCITLKENTEIALKETGKEAEIIKVMDFKDIMAPALVINEKVVSFGKVLKPKEIIKILESSK